MKFTQKVQAAKKFAELIHGEQRYGASPYVVHLQDVADVLVLDCGVTDKDELAAAFLHDSIEDTGVSKATIADLFGDRVAELVDAVSDEQVNKETGQPYKNRKERKAATYPKIKSVLHATRIKLADRIANIRHSVEARNAPMFFMYKKENSEFQKALRVIGEYDEMWAKIDSLLAQGEAIFMASTAKRVVEPEM